MIKMEVKSDHKFLTKRNKDLDLIITNEKIPFRVKDQMIFTKKLIKELIVIIFLSNILCKGFLQIVHNIKFNLTRSYHQYEKT